MTFVPDRHLPTAEFRERLEHEVLRELGAPAAGLLPARRTRSFHRVGLRTAAVILLSMGLGAAAGVGSAQVRDNQQRARLLAVEQAELALERLRLELARAHEAEAQERVQMGVAGREALLEAQTQLRAMQAELARTQLDIAEIQASSIPVRNDLAAPVLDGRDFVRERLDLQLALAQQRLFAAEQARAQAEQRFDVGAAEAQALIEPMMAEAQSRAELERLAARRAIREAYLQDDLTPEEVAERIERAEATTQLRLSQQLRELTEIRLKEMEERVRVGAADELEVLRARMEAAQQAAEIERLRARLEALDGF